MIIKPKIIGGDSVGTGSITVKFLYLDIENGKLVNKITERYCNIGETVTPPTIPTTLDAVTKQSCALTFKEWNYTNAQLTNIQTDMNVGAVYNTSDSKTHAFVTVNANTGYDLPIYFNKSDNSTLTISWGDGSTNYTTSDSGDITTTHTYSTAGTYEITIWISSGTGTFGLGYFSFGSTLSFIGGSSATYRQCLNNIFVDGQFRNILGGAFINNLSLEIAIFAPTPSFGNFGNYCFYGCSKLYMMTIQTGIIYTGDNGFANCINLCEVSFPYGLTTISYSSFNTCSSLRSACFPSTLTTLSAYAFTSCNAIKKVYIPSSVVNLSYAFEYCSGLREIIVDANVNSLQDIFVGCSSLRKIEINSNIATLQNTFSNNYSCTVYTIKRFTAPSTITNLYSVGSLNGINLQARIYVPVGSETVYKTATNWSTYANYIYEDTTENRALFGD